MDTLNKPTWKDAHDVIMGLKDLYHKEDDTVLIEKISDLKRQITQAAESRKITAKKAIKALTGRISDAKIKIQAARRAKIEEKLRPLETKNQELEAKVDSLNNQDTKLITTIESLEDRERKLVEQIETVKQNGNVEERRLRNTVSLYVNSCSIAWDREDSNSVFCTVGGATSVKKVRLDRDATEFEIANQLWDLMEE